MAQQIKQLEGNALESAEDRRRIWERLSTLNADMREASAEMRAVTKEVGQVKLDLQGGLREMRDAQEKTQSKLSSFTTAMYVAIPGMIGSAIAVIIAVRA